MESRKIAEVNKPLESAIDVIKTIAEHRILKHRKKESQVQALREEMGYNGLIIVPSCQC
jgi:hypothetical protein